MNRELTTVISNEPQFVPLSAVLSDENKLELLEYWRSITKRKWAILSLGLMIAVVAAAITFALTPLYRSTVTILIEPGKSKILSIEDVYTGGTAAREHYQTQVEILKSREVALRTATALKLWNYPEFDPRKSEESWWSKLKASLGISGGPSQWTEERLAEATAGSFASALSVEPVRLSELVKVSFDSQDKGLAALAANTLATIYIDADREARLNMSQGATNWLQDKLESLRGKLNKSEQELQTYREQKGLVNLSGSAQTLAGQQISEVTQRLSEARGKRTELESAYRQAQQITDGDYSSIPLVINNPAVVSARAQVDTAAQKLATLSEHYGPQYTGVIETQTQLKVARDTLRQQMRSVINSLTHEYEAARSTEGALNGQLNAARGSVQDVNRDEFQLAVLDREVQTNKQLYEMFMSRAKETSIGSDLQSAVARVVDPAIPARVPVKPQKTQIVMVALVLGLFLGVLGSLLLDKLDNTLKGADDAEHRLRQPVLTSLPELKAGDATAAIRLFFDQPQSHFAESIRTARTGVLLSNIDLLNKIIIVTSSVPGEGKTTLCTNLAMAHSQTKRTLLIDADMRRPQIGKRLGMPSNVKGLSNLVAGTAALEECVHLLENSSLAVMPVGAIPPNPLEMLLSQRFRDTLAVLAERFEIIIIDSPPVELVSDALVIAPLTSGIIYVVKAMDTPYPLARKGIVRLQRAGANILGVVLNHLDFTKAQRYYGDYSGQGKYGYGDYGYASEESTETEATEPVALPVFRARS